MMNNWEAIITKDINNCKKAIESKNEKELLKICNIIPKKYAQDIPNLCDFLKEEEDLVSKVELISEILKTQMARIYTQNKRDFRGVENNISINNNNMNNVESTNNISLNAKFEAVQQEINSMESLATSEIDEINAKIDELKRIIESKAKRADKWKSVAEVLKWVADKGVDVGIALLPLFLNI